MKVRPHFITHSSAGPAAPHTARNETRLAAAVWRASPADRRGAEGRNLARLSGTRAPLEVYPPQPAAPL